MDHLGCLRARQVMHVVRTVEEVRRYEDRSVREADFGHLYRRILVARVAMASDGRQARSWACKVYLSSYADLKAREVVKDDRIVKPSRLVDR